MTAEIAIMNKEAIALASDSAVTMIGESGQKIFTSANKLFSLSKYHPVGIMIYGSAIFMRVPWETIIKIYRNKLGKNKKKFDTLKEYANDFIEFLDNGNPLFPNSVQEEHLRNSIYAYFNFIKDTITKKVQSNIEENGEITDEEIEQIVSQIIKEHFDSWEKTDNIPSISKSFNKKIIKKYEKIIDKAIEEVFEKLPLSKWHSNQLKKVAASLFSKFPEGIQKGDISGVVIAGFGDEDTFPSVRSFHIEGIVNNKLKYEEHISVKIDFETSASIIPFAQREMVDIFMEGVDPSYRDIEESYLSSIFNEYAGIVVDSLERSIDEEKKQLKEKLVKIGEEILNGHSEKLEEYREEKYISPVTSVVSMLPKDELAAMAESLVNLTSFKRKVTMESETVGGPVDVAVISKGDGFIWIKRKHYFEAELNPQFFANYYKDV
jgi:hypothetical protein